MLNLALHPETEALIEALKRLGYRETITYKQLSEALGRDVRFAQSRLASARRIVLRDHAAAFVVERGVGLRRLAPEEAPDMGQAARKKIARASRSARRTMTHMVAGSNGLPEETQRRLSREMAVHGLIAHMTTDKSVSAIPESETPTPPAKAYAALAEALAS